MLEVFSTPRSLPVTRGFAASLAFVALAAGCNGTRRESPPYPHAQRLVVAVPAAGAPAPALTGPGFARYRARSTSFEALALAWTENAEWTGLGATVRVHVAAVETAGVPVLLGRGFISGDALPDAQPVVLLSEEFWRRSLGGDPGVVGKSITLDATSQTILGVVPQGFELPERVEVWRPGGPIATTDAGQLLGRLRPGVDLAQAQGESLALGAGIALQQLK